METKKKKPARQWGGFNIRVRDDCFHPAINARTFTCHQDLPAFPTRPPAFCQPATFTPSAADASIFSVAAAFSQQPSVDRRRRPPLPRKGVHMYTCVQRESLLSVVWRIPPPWDHVYIVFNRASMSRRRRRRRGV